MKYFDEKKMQPIRKKFEAYVLGWPGVASKEMMGCLCYFRGKKFFAFLVTGGIVLTKLGKEDRSELRNKLDGKPFEMAGRTASSWIQLPLGEPGDLGPLLTYIRKSYEAASG
jgi:hypothetical protein